ncbi:adenylate cyclase [Sugiyamaella lignohabitans]|uniref:Adenylate cyclase n=1 Tax=Sugiyamaella lignohabitans TaxID=796027 RepID=A0A167FNF3_9ASCO|nr:adenylate cyclase [Sugiyamaella lignohabitans]ANB15511.1 adenylate cyclase [Sugiyamaella lignohabitans]
MGTFSHRSSREQSLDLTDYHDDQSKLTFDLDTDLGEMTGIIKDTLAGEGETTERAVEETQWAAPESWAVSKETPLTEDALWANGDAIASAPKKTNFFLRVFREDGTFGTVSCPLYATVSELIQMLGRKFFLPSVAGYKLSVRSGGLTRLLQPNERPVLLQKILLEFMGYTERDRIAELGREDLSYLCRFEFSKTPFKQFGKDDRVYARDVTTVALRDMHLQTIPIVIFQKASEIESLDVSENPSIILPLDFIQACARLKELKFISNHCLQFPANILKTAALTHLDLSNNLLITLDNIDFGQLQHLQSLNLQGNRLTNLPDNISKLEQLKVLNMSSNNLTHVNPALCRIESLIELDFSFNRIEELPDEIGQLKQLEKLGMTNNYLSKELPKTFNNLVSLVDLDVRYNKLQNIDILSELPRLSMLYVSKNSVHTFQHSFHRLSMFYFDRNPITKIFFKEPLHSLTVLNLRKAKLTVLSDDFLKMIPMIERLVLDGNHLVTLPPGIGSLKKLLYLSIVANELSSLPPEIGNLKELRTLDLHSNNLKSLPEELWNLSSLMVLNISSNLLDSFPKPNFHIGSIGSADSMAPLYKSLTASVANREEFSDSYELRTVDDRRPSVMSVQSIPSPKDGSSRRISIYPPLQPIPSYDESDSTTTNDVSASPRGRPCLSHSLSILRAADNRFNDDCYQELSLLSELQVLNLSYNELVDIPYGALGRLTRLRELYLSGNNLSSLPADDFQNTKTLRVFYVNSNKLHSLPAEVGKISHLQVFDVGSNNLRYNINNWPYDWNWNWNRELKYLNFSGNRRLEIKNMHGATSHSRGEDNQRNLSDFTVLTNLRVLGLMDVTLMTPSVPDQTENCRVRTYGSDILSMSYGMADSLGAHDNLSTMDLVIERFRGNEKEAIIGLFDGRNKNREGGNKVSKLIQETFGNIFDDELSKLREGESVSDALRRAFLSTNKEIGNTTMLPSEEIARTFIAHRSSTAANLDPDDRSTGSCATIVYINDNRMFVANVGDTMALLSKGNGDYTVLTTRHDPTSKEELERIREGAGIVSSDGRLDNVLDVSRAIGFYNLIPHIHAAPSIAEYDLTDADDFLILASKQLWEYVTYEMAVDLARTEIDDPMLAAQKLRDFAIAYGCNDKIMVMVIAVGGFRRKAKYKGSTGGNINHLGSLAGAEEELFPSLKKRRDKSLLPEDSSLARLGGEVEPPVGDVAMVFTDIKNSTLLWETYPVAMRSAIKTHNAIMRRNIRIMGGYEVKTEGDAFIVSFPTPTSALLWCFSVQSQLLVADWPAEIVESKEGGPVTDSNDVLIFRGLSVRMGIHWGRPVCETDVITKRMDYFGPMVNRTARISAVADGGQITLSSDFLSEIKRLDKAHKRVLEGTSLPEAYGDEALGESMDRNMKMLHQLGYIVQDLGEMKLKGLENPESISVIYPKSLRGRLEHHEQNRTPEQIKQQTTSFGGVMGGDGKPDMRQPKRPSHPLGHGAVRAGGLTMDLLQRLRSVSNRLEKVCSQLNMPAIDMTAFSDYDRKTNANVMAVVPNTDYDYILFFEQLVTRIENALSTLYIRAASNNIRHHYASEGPTDTLSELADILKKMSILVVENRIKLDSPNPTSSG